MADLVGLRSGKESEAEEEVECAFDPEHPQPLKRSEGGERAGVMGSATPDASVTAPLFLHHAHPREDNRRSHHDGSWVEPTGRVTNASRASPHDISRNHYGDQKVQAMGSYAAAFRLVTSWVQTTKWFKF
jgi:hypothetical protein